MLYRANRIGRYGKPFVMFKFQTLKPSVGSFATEERYTRFGKFLRKWRLDEVPQLWNFIKGDMRIAGIRPMDKETYLMYPQDVRERLTSIKPGWFSLSGIFFMDEEKILIQVTDPHRAYFEQILPIKLVLDMFYLENRCMSLDIWIVWCAIKRRIKTGLFSK